MASTDPHTTEISRHIWETRYRAPGEDHLEDTWARVARALAQVEAEPVRWEARFHDALRGFRFLPGGRILAGAGTAHDVTLFNCFVMGVIPDALDAILDALKEGALTMQRGGGVGYDFSTLRPAGSHNERTGTVASGPVSFMRMWDAMCATVLSTGARRGAMMATLRCDHPDIERFVDAKADSQELRRFNVSVQVTDDFLAAVRDDALWPLVFPASGAEGRVVLRRWTGSDRAVPCQVYREVRARDLWERILAATWAHAEPGVLFIDRINEWNNLGYRERITATNPCGEIPLQPYGACDLGSIDLVSFVRDPFSPRARLDLQAITALVPVAVRMLDNVVDVSRFPLPAQEAQAHGTRRVGLGITGLADALILLGLRYDSPEARKVASSVMRTICLAAYRASVALAREKGAFPFLDVAAYLERPFVARLPEDIRQGIARHGIRNSHLLAIAPTGTISLLANNVSSGVEPPFAWRYRRDVLGADATPVPFELQNRAWRAWRQREPEAPLPHTFLRADEVGVGGHIGMAAALQEWVDNAVSKTILVPADADFAEFRDVYDLAWRRGLKGCTTWRPNAVTGTVLQDVEVDGVHCCTLDREDAG